MNKIFKENKCPSAPRIKKKFLFFKSEEEGVHDFELKYISKFMKSSIDYVVYGKCKYCDKEINRHFVTHEELIRYGFDKDFLNTITDNIIVIEEDKHLKEMINNVIMG